MISFPLFESDKKTFHLNIENSLLLGLLFFGILNSFKYFQAIANYGLIIIMILGLIYMITNFTRIRPLNGKLEGLLTFNEDNLNVNNNTYSIENISKIFMRINDFEGRRIGHKLSIYPNLSNGTNNVLHLELKNGEKINVFFKSEFKFDYEKLRPFVIQLIMNDLMTIEEGCKILKPYTDYEITKLRNQVQKRAN